MRFQSIYENDYNGQFGGSLGADIDLRIIEEQLEKYYGYVEKGRKNSAYGMAKDTLDRLSEGLQGNFNMVSVIREMTEIFNMLAEHGFPIGKSQYPGPSLQWKKLVDQYLGDA